MKNFLPEVFTNIPEEGVGYKLFNHNLKALFYDYTYITMGNTSLTDNNKDPVIWYDNQMINYISHLSKYLDLKKYKEYVTDYTKKKWGFTFIRDLESAILAKKAWNTPKDVWKLQCKLFKIHYKQGLGEFEETQFVKFPVYVSLCKQFTIVNQVELVEDII